MDKCNLCDLCNSAHNVCQLGEGKKGAKIMVVADCPSEMENKRNKVFGSRSSMNLKASLEKRGIPLDDVYWTYAVKCWVPNDKEPSQKQLTACLDYLMAEIDVVNPSIIVPLGNIAMKAVLGKVGITKRRGKAVEVNNRVILPTYHPKATLRKPLYKKYLFKDLDNLADIYKNGVTTQEVNYRVLNDYEEILDELERLNTEAEWLVFDIETSGLNPFLDDSKVVCISLSDRERYGAVIPLYHRQSPLWGDERGIVVKKLRELLENPKIKKVAHNGKFDMYYLKNWLNIEVSNFCFDTLLAHYIAVSEEQGYQGLKGLAWEYTDMGGYDNDLDEYKDTLPEGDRNNYDNIPWDILSQYAGADADCTFRLLTIFKPLIDENPKWVRLMNEILIPASYELGNMESSGMYYDVELSEQYKIAYQCEIKRLQDKLESYPEVLEIEREKQELYAKRQALLKSVPNKERTPEQKEFVKSTAKYKDYKFNWNSVVQLQELLFDRLQLETTYKTEKGKPSTSEDALIEMSSQHELPLVMLDYRKVNTLNNMFIQKLPELVDDKHMVHPSFNLSGTVTGRLASENPNAQQFPRKSENPLSFQYHHEIKRLFKSRFGAEGAILQFDYSQLELRVAGMFSKDKKLTEVFTSGQDLHKATASMVWKIPVEEVTTELRTNAKAVNFGIIYGKSGITFAKDLYGDLPWKEAKEKGFALVDDYLNTFSGLHQWMKDTLKFAKKNGYVETLFGRQRRLPDLRSKDDFLRSEAERQAINAPIQGTGSDMTLLSIVKIQQWLKANNMKTKMICTVHDSIVFDVYIYELPEVFNFIKNTMEHVHEDYVDTPIPIVSEAELGNTYGDIYEIDDASDINSPEVFQVWLKEQQENKLQWELDYLKDKEYTEKQIQEYLKLYHGIF